MNAIELSKSDGKGYHAHTVDHAKRLVAEGKGDAEISISNLEPAYTVWNYQGEKITVKKPASITIIGRRWFQKLYGNTYFTAQIIVDGVCVKELPREYGYGSMYEQQSVVWLKENGYMPNAEKYEWSLWRYCNRNDIVSYTSHTDVSRQKDL